MHCFSLKAPNPELNIQYTAQIKGSRMCKPGEYLYKRSSYTEIHEVLQSLRQNKVLCDIKLETDDKQTIVAHKVVLSSASPYFHAMFINFAEKNHDVVAIHKLDSTTLKLLVNFIYSGEIVVTEENVQDLLQAGNFLQLQEVNEACCNFLQSQLSPTNCFAINAIADLHNCTKLLTSSELYIQTHFEEVVASDEFLSLSFKQVVKLISSNELIVSSEEKVFESVIRWVKHELCSRQCNLPLLMEHVRLPLTSKHFILKKVIAEPLIKNCLKCKDYIIEALYFHLLKSDEPVPLNIRNKPRHGYKFILVARELRMEQCIRTEWYDPKKNYWYYGTEMILHRHSAAVEIVNDNLVFAVGGYKNGGLASVNMLQLYLKSPFWKPSVDMFTKRYSLGVGVINNYLYAVGGMNEIDGYLNSAEVFDINTQKWHMIPSMSTGRADFGVGVLNDILYAVGGCNSSSVNSLDTVECYHPGLDTWTPVAKMCEPRRGVRVGVLDGVLYAVGGVRESNVLMSSVEAYRPSTGLWTSIADMHFPRSRAGVVALNGLLYVIGGLNENTSLDCVECYCPHTNKWSLVPVSMNFVQTVAGAVAINITQQYYNC